VTAFGEAMAYSGLASAARGYDIPAGINPLVQMHAQEMALPAEIAQPWKAILRDWRTGGGAAGGLGGDTHFWHIAALDPRTFETYLRRNANVVTKILGEQARRQVNVAMGLGG
jgi:hypothetical protein